VESGVDQRRAMALSGHRTVAVLVRAQNANRSAGSRGV